MASPARFSAKLDAACKHGDYLTMVRVGRKKVLLLVAKVKVLSPPPSQRAVYSRFVADTRALLMENRLNPWALRTVASRIVAEAVDLHAPACGKSAKPLPGPGRGQAVQKGQHPKLEELTCHQPGFPARPNHEPRRCRVGLLPHIDQCGAPTRSRVRMS